MDCQGGWFLEDFFDWASGNEEDDRAKTDKKIATQVDIIQKKKSAKIQWDKEAPDRAAESSRKTTLANQRQNERNKKMKGRRGNILTRSQRSGETDSILNKATNSGKSLLNGL